MQHKYDQAVDLHSLLEAFEKRAELADTVGKNGGEKGAFIIRDELRAVITAIRSHIGERGA